jgi:L-malate glycosyltransferase
MKVAFYNHTEAVSGAEISLLLTARHIQGIEPMIFAPEGELLDRAREQELAVVPIRSHRARMTRNPLRLARDLFGMVRAGWTLAGAVRRHRIDLIHANSIRAGMIASLFTWLHRRPVVWHVRDIPPSGIMGKAIERLGAMAAHAIIGISQAVVHSFDRARLGSKLHLVHNGMELRETTPSLQEEHRLRMRRELDTPEEQPVIAVIGQIAPWKRQEDAIRALRKLTERGSNAMLWIVGEPKFREENVQYDANLRQLVRELQLDGRVRFTGFRRDILEICAAADLLLLCSDNEPFGRVIIEAMSQSLPVVATDSGGVPEIVVHGKTGLLYRVGDIDGLVGNISELLEYPGLRQGMGYLGAERVREAFTIQGTARRVEEIYAKLAALNSGMEYHIQPNSEPAKRAERAERGVAI